ncbi:MAG: hypothetical protein IPP94_12720 [Ignavibacteria bacterium]|nr:hypothetical protein [Ignavibacteria bacterium]
MRILASIVFLAVALSVPLTSTRAQASNDADKLIMRLRPVCNAGQGGLLVIAFDIKARAGGSQRLIGGYSMVLTYIHTKLVIQGVQQRYQTGVWPGGTWYINQSFGAAAWFNQHSAQMGNPGNAMPLNSTYWSSTTDCAGNPLGDGFFEVLRYAFQINPSANGTVDFSMYNLLSYKYGEGFQHGAEGSAMYYSALADNSNDSSILIRNLIIPVELSALDASMQDDRTVLLTWRTENEQLNQGFDVERGDGTTFEKIGFVPGRGTTSSPEEYRFIDTAPVSTDGRPYVFYRLRQIDSDGKATYSHIVSTRLPAETVGLGQNYPNPVAPGEGTVIPYSLAVPGTVRLEIYNALGQKVATLVDGTALDAGRFEAAWDGRRSDGTLAGSGVYFTRFSAAFGNGETYTTSRQFSVTR